jgi:IclR family mhp operon transcriptional activator
MSKIKSSSGPGTELNDQDDEKEFDKRGMIRVIGRGISVLQAINRAESLTMMEIAETSGVPYATAFRIVQTLIAEGMLERASNSKRYRLTPLVQTLSVGYQIEDRLVATARPYIVELTKKLSWPISVSTRVGTRMMVRDSTHAQTSLAFHIYHPGYTLPMLESSSGRTYLSFCPDEERERIMATLKSLDRGVNELPPRMNEILNIFEQTRKNGYGTHSRTRHTENPGKTSSISTPVFRNDSLVGTLTLIFFASAITMEDAAQSFVTPMKAAAAAVSSELSGGL